MKRTLLLCIAVLGIFLSTNAHPIDQATAKDIAVKFMGTGELSLAATYTTTRGIAAFYVFNTTDGFVIVAADDCETPIIGYSHEGCFQSDNVPAQMENYLQDFADRIQYGIENHIVADETTSRQWSMVKATGRLNDVKNAHAVEPLLTDHWHQGCLYNSLCPEMDGPCGRAEVGCVAVAIGQIMHYHGYPEMGWGSHSYFNLGQSLSADFGSTSYDWEHMPDLLTEQSSEAEIEAVATLLYHCGVAVEMAYSTNGSIASASAVPNVMVRYFNYSKQIHREKRANYSTEDWMNLLKDNLDLQRPIQYSASGNGLGHSFVCDGYDENDMLHFNWGWGGSADGYFALGSLNPNGYELNSNHYATLDIIPQYEPYIIEATTFPEGTGVIQGDGEYHRGDICTLSVTPAENARFLYWKRGNTIVSRELTYSFEVVQDIDDVVAHFSLYEVSHISANYYPDPENPQSPYVNLEWDTSDGEWPLLKQFTLDEGTGIATDNEYIYTYNQYGGPYQCKTIYKYTLDGELVDVFDLPDANIAGIAWDGNYFYCSNMNDGFNMYCYDFSSQTLVSTVRMGAPFGKCSYDAENDGFWLGTTYINKQIELENRQGETIISGPTFRYTTICGLGKITATDGTPHLLVLEQDNTIVDYDINKGTTDEHLSLGTGLLNGACLGKYEGKDAMFVLGKHSTNSNVIKIFEINKNLGLITGYRIYRIGSHQDTAVMIADGLAGTSYIDPEWDYLEHDDYRYGICAVFGNGAESEKVWTEPIANHGCDIDENGTIRPEPSVQKVIDNGQIIIIKDGIRYGISGQRLN